MNASTLHPLQTLDSVRSQCQKVYEKTLNNEGAFTLDPAPLQSIIEDLKQLIQSKYSSLEAIPPHSRLNHIPPNLLAQLPSDSKLERTQSVLDIVIVSVILDAGAGNVWKFKRDGYDIGRSEGIAIATFYMFLEGKFSHRKGVVDREGLQRLTLEAL